MPDGDYIFLYFFNISSFEAIEGFTGFNDDTIELPTCVRPVFPYLPHSTSVEFVGLWFQTKAYFLTKDNDK